MPAVNPKQMVREAYDLASHAYRGDECDLEQSGYGHWLRRLARHVPSGARVLDLGCGSGVPVARELAKRSRVTGVDISPSQIARARTLVPEADFLCADMTEVAFEPGAFDAVVAFYAIINVPLDEQPALFERIGGWLEPGGAFLGIVGKYPATFMERNFRGVEGATMYWSYGGIREYREWIGRAGLEIVEEGSQPARAAGRGSPW